MAGLEKDNLERISECINRLKKFDVAKTPEAKELITRIGNVRIEEVPREDLLAATMLYNFALYQNAVCDLIDEVVALSGYHENDIQKMSAATDLMSEYNSKMTETSRKYDEELSYARVLAYGHIQKTAQQRLEEAADQWDRLTEKINSLNDAVSNSDGLSDITSARVWQSSLMLRSIEVNGEAAKFAQRFNELISNINIEKQECSSGNILS